MADLDFTVGISGVEEAVNGLKRVADTNKKAADEAKRAANETSEAIAQMGGRTLAALDAANRLTGGTFNLERGLGRVAVQAALAAQQIGDLSNLATRLGGATAGGLAVGALIPVATVAISQQVAEALEDARIESERIDTAWDTATASLRDFVASAGDVVEAAEEEHRIATATADILTQQAASERARADLTRGIARRMELEEQLQEALLDHDGHRVAQIQRALHAQEATIETLREQNRHYGELYQLALLREESETKTRAELEGQALAQEQLTRLAERAVRGNEAARRRRGGRRDTTDFSGRELDRIDAEALRLRAKEEEQRAATAAAITADLLSEATSGNGFVRPEDAEIERVDLDVIAEGMDRLKERQGEVAQAALDASKTFETSWRGGLDAVRDAFEEANRALADAGQEMLGTGDLLAMSFRAIGDDISTTIGETMTGAFRQALTAWLDGSKSFVEAAEDMAKGVIKALTVEAIVQTVVETARGLAAFASQNYPEGIQHLTAAAAWAAVGAVAGGVGAAVGAFGGGGGATAQAEQGDRQLSARDTREVEGRGDVIFQIFPGVMSTERETAGAVYEALSIMRREGFSVPGA